MSSDDSTSADHASAAAATTQAYASVPGVSSSAAVAPTDDFFLSELVDHDAHMAALTLESARRQPVASTTPYADRLDAMTHLPRYMPSSDSMAFPDPLPSLSAMLIQNRLLGDKTAWTSGQRDSTAATTMYRPIVEPFNTLSENDWDQLLVVSEPVGEYISPDIAPFLNGNGAIQGPEELEINGREFLSSPAIPVIGTVPRVFDDMLVPIHLLDPTYSRPAPDTGVYARHERRDKPLTAPSLPSFEAIRDRTRAPTHPVASKPKATPAILRSATFKLKATGKSARTRLFRSPPDDDKENQPENGAFRQTSSIRTRQTQSKLIKLASSIVMKSASNQPHQADPKPIKLTGHAAKMPLGTNRRSLDSATTPPVAPPIAQLTSRTARKSKDCSVVGCVKGARSRGLCKRHGGGKRCSYGNCTRSDQGGGLCIAHGGGKRCSIAECTNSAQSRGFCKSHGGGARCSEPGCTKSSQSRGFCRAHGGAKLCKASVCFNYRHRGDLCRSHSAAQEEP